jgi:tetratricopeptide (TPR) repeat protein
MPQPVVAQFGTEPLPGIALGQIGNIEAAMAEQEEAARIDPDNGHKFFFNMGAVLVNSNQSAAAGRAFRRSVEMNAGYAEAHYQYAAWLLTQSRFGDARDELETYLRMAPNGPNAQGDRNQLEALNKMQR